MATIYDPIKIGTMELPNRFVHAPTVRNNADENGYLTERAIRDYIEGARGGWGLYQFSASFPHPEGNPFRCMVGIHDTKSVLGHQRVVRYFHLEGMKISCQILHGGAICDSNMTGYPAVSATEKGGIYRPNKALSISEVEERVQMYVDAAARIQEAGYDAVNIHSCQGTLNQQFMSPYTNTREDKFGEDRGLFVELVAKGVREAVGPDFPIIWRLAAHEFMEYLGEQAIQKNGARLSPSAWSHMLTALMSPADASDLRLCLHFPHPIRKGPPAFIWPPRLRASSAFRSWAWPKLWTTKLQKTWWPVVAAILQ